ncbi:hypothetical protein Pint_09023 [Pistacia integerrima]|uniref:Uncharacterized protein n=1 Tax=Pistacia integerrima TaxID=434235 RepID=A0ACC0XUK3_9ROSI|nr:hypothetical protein Pint_09023 [Pistacia integerrima]
MTTYNSSVSYKREGFATSFSGDQKFVNCVDPPSRPDNVTMYVSQASGSYSEILSSFAPHNYAGIPSTGVRNEMIFIPPTSGAASLPSIDGQLNTETGNSFQNSVSGDSKVISVHDGEQNFQCQGLSLSLGTKMSSVGSLPSFQYQYPNPNFSSFLSSHLPVSGKGTLCCEGDESEKGKELRNPEGLLSDFETQAFYNSQHSISHNELHSSMYQYEPTGFTNTSLKSKYIKAAQELLDEVINVQKALKRSDSNKEQNCHGTGLDDSKGTDGKSSSRSVTNSSPELSHAERQDLQNKKTKLLSMLEEVDRKYKQYYHQMQIVVSSFDMVGGRGAAKSYTALALQTISRHFRTLRDAISRQIQENRRSLGEQDTSSNCQGSIPRLRFIDHQLRQQRALQQFGAMRHAWRPQRGLPESSVSILRAWLFEHFLHPYPNDSDKIKLARQTGLSRNQVANWFINARVRLWKPMVEEMYKEEFGDPEVNFKTCQDNAPKACSENSSAPEDRGEELRDSLTSTQVHDLKSDYIPDAEMNKFMLRSVFQNGENGLNSGMMRLQNDQRPNMDDHRLYGSIPLNQNSNNNNVLIGDSGSYGISELSGLAVSNQVSLALGLRHHESDVFPPISTGTQIGGNGTIDSPVGHHDTVDYQCMDMGNNQQDRFGNPHLLHDFVV